MSFKPMLLSRTCQYAISGVLRLAALPRGGFCRVDDLVDGTDAPRHAVAKVFHELAKRGVLNSLRGAGGGFRLAERAQYLTLMDVVEAVDGPWAGAVLGARGLCPPTQDCPLSRMLQPINNQLEQLLRSVRIIDLVQNDMPPPPNCCLGQEPCSAHAGDGAVRTLPEVAPLARV
jgi:Rrf2 family transcriptional regulator, iron-sulfur cluster assembly transcription factor